MAVFREHRVETCDVEVDLSTNERPASIFSNGLEAVFEVHIIELYFVFTILVHRNTTPFSLWKIAHWAMLRFSER